MPRRNRRERAAPLDLTQRPIEAVQAPAHAVLQPHQRRVRSKAQLEALQAERQREARIKGGIDWETCLVPGCGRTTMSFSVTPPHRRDPLVEIPLCDTHGVVAWKTVQFHRPGYADSIAAIDELHERRGATRERRIVVDSQGGEGIIYFLRHNGLVKVGWTGDFAKRLRAYGPATVVLCHYPGTRQDETTLHRQLRPSLAKGREWYHDDALIALFVNDAIKRHGKPRITDGHWTEPKPDRAAKPRKWSA